MGPLNCQLYLGLALRKPQVEFQVLIGAFPSLDWFLHKQSMQLPRMSDIHGNQWGQDREEAGLG